MNQSVRFVAVLVFGCKLLSLCSRLHKKVAKRKVDRLTQELVREAIPQSGMREIIRDVIAAVTGSTSSHSRPNRDDLN